MAQERADVLVIGSGPAGAALTKRLTDLEAKVVCLEQGDWVNPADFPSVHENWETALRRGPFHGDPNVRKRPEDYPVQAVGEVKSIQMFNGVGGTIWWDGYFPRFRPSDFRVRRLDGVADDWPISYEDLQPYYDMNDREIGVSGFIGDPANPPRSPRSTLPVAFGAFGETMARGFDKLGWYWWPADNAILSDFYDERPPCQLHGKCLFGCVMTAKATAATTYWPKAVKKGAVLKTWCRVREVTVDAQGRARGAIYFDRQGNQHEVLAKVVVVSCNGVGTPRLLLNSKSRLFPQGLANSSGMVGKNFMVHPFRYLEGVFDLPMHAEQGIPIPLLSQQFYETDPSRGFVRGYCLLAHGGFGPLHNAWGGSVGKPVACGAEHHRSMRKRFPHTIRMALHGEDLPEEHNRVELDPELKDTNGIPGARVIYKHSENSLKMLEHGTRMGRQAFEAAGAIEINVGTYLHDVAHLMGTARMGDDPRRSVVNAWNQAHDVKNLFVVDGSSFTTCSAVNPTSTIGALALRAADGIWQRRREWS